MIGQARSRHCYEDNGPNCQLSYVLCVLMDIVTHIVCIWKVVSALFGVMGTMILLIEGIEYGV